MKRIAMLFPGQGSQYVGMGKALHARDAAARALFDEAGAICGIDLARLCFEDPDGVLHRTEYTQPALLACSVAHYRDFVARSGVRPAFFAGHSLGELSALVASEALPFADGVRLARARGLAMSEAAGRDGYGMRAVTKLDRAAVEAACAGVDGYGVEFVLANYNAREQCVLSGALPALDRAAEALKQAGGTVIPLKVSGAFHSPFMAPAADAFARALALVTWSRPRAPVIANVTAQPHGDGAAIAESLVRQLTAPVRWVETMALLEAEGVEHYLEAGPRAVLKKLALDAAPAARAHALDEDDEAITLAFAAEMRALRERPGLVGRCLAVAVCTRNANWNEDEYQRGVVEPYRELQAMQQRLDENGGAPAVDDLRRALDLLGRIFATKGTAADERAWRLEQILDATGTRDALAGYRFDAA